MPRKTNPEKDVVITSASAAPARLKRVAPAPRTKRPAAASATPAKPARETETITVTAAIVVQRELSHEEIARVAYSLWESRGCQGGNPEEDWLRAEEHLRLGVER